MVSGLTETMRKCSKQAQEARDGRDDEACKKAVLEYEETLDKWVLFSLIKV